RERDALLQTPILFLSSEKDLSRQLRALSLGGDDFLVKPIDPEHFVSAVSSRARRARQNRAIQRRLEISLYEREREHRALDHHAIVSVTNAKGEIIRVNDQFCAISGYRPEELLGQNHHVVKSDEHPPEFYRDLWRTIARGEVWQGDICNRRKDGKLYWVASTITPFLDERGKPYQYVSIRTDITHVKAAEALQRAQNAMRGVVGKAAAGLLAADAETMDAAIEQALRQAGEHLGVDRAYLFLLNDNATRMSNSHEWSAPGIAPQKDILQDIPVESAPWWWAQILGNQPVIVSDVAALPSEAAAEKTMFQSLDIRALCGFPIRRGDVTQGFIGFDQVSMARDWDAPALDLLRLLAGQMGSALLRAASEREVQRQHRFTQDVLDSVSANIAVLNRDGIIVAVNEPWRRFAIQNAEQAGAPVPNTDIGTNYLAVCRQPAASDSHDVEDVATTGINAVMSGQVPSFRHEYPCPSPDKPRWFEMTVMPLSGGGGVVISHVNITERKLAEQAADSARERLRRGQIYANIGTWEWNIVTGDLFWTERIAPLFGYPEGDLETSYDNFLAAVHPDDRQAVTGAVSACIEYDKPYDIEHRVIWPDGTERWLLERGAVVRDAEGKPLQMIGVVQDIDDRKRAEMVLAEREHQLVEAQALASLGNWSADLVTGDLIWSDEIYRIFGYEPGSFVPSVEAFHSFVHPDDLDKVHASEKQATETGHHDVVHRIIRKDGSVRHVHELAQAETDDNGKLVRLTGTVQDITSEVQIRESLIAATEEAERANKAKSDFLSSMSHELRTPMNAIIGFSQLLDYDDELRADQKENVSEILKAGEHLLELINEVLDLAKVESGKIDLSLEAVEVCPVVEECVTLISTLADQKQINITHRGLAGILVRADRTRLKQALLNLLSNAIKYNREAGTVRIEIQSTDKDYLRIAITDTGWGIARNKLEQLFQPFSRLDAENSNIEGTGIGLALTRRLVEMMGGRVDVQSKEGVGSTFCIELPVVTLPGDTFNPINDDTNNEIANPASTDQPENQNTILYIEDNPANLKLVSRLLRRRKHVDLLTAHTPDLGIELAMARQPELILLDINLPGMDGYEVLNVLQSESRTRNIPVIAITANAMPRDIEYGKQAGFAYYLTKPLDIVQFNNALDHILADAAEGQDKK
ncbi:MAG: PAS domain-containing protein, partial [Pseudomonadota bacterium]